MPLAPGTAAQPAIWRWAEARPHLMRAAELITAEEADRRVLMLENPALKGTTFATTTLYAGLQVILPGEIARTHRHAPNALRFIIEGVGAYTAVEGERVMMRPGDFITTPGWTWHDHGNVGEGPVTWLDGLDTAFANLFGAHFREDHPQRTQAAARATGVSAARYGANLLPLEYRAQGRGCPLLSYPYERTREALERLAENGDPLRRTATSCATRIPSREGTRFRQWRCTRSGCPGDSRAPDIAVRMAQYSASSKVRAASASAGRGWILRRTTFLSCRPGRTMYCAPTRRPCSSAIPTARRRRRWVSGAKSGAIEPRTIADEAMRIREWRWTCRKSCGPG